MQTSVSLLCDSTNHAILSIALQHNRLLFTNVHAFVQEIYLKRLRLHIVFFHPPFSRQLTIISFNCLKA